MVYREYCGIIKNYVVGKRVLDVGCVGINSLYQTHIWLNEHAGDVTGLDNNLEGIKKMSRWGYNVVHGNAEEFDLGEDYDVIVALELLEHLANPGKFLDCCKKHMQDNSVLILSVPNAQSFHHILRDGESPWHLQSYNHRTLRQLLEFCGFDIIALPNMRGYNPRRLTANPVRMAYRVIGYILTTVCPQFQDGLLVVAKKKRP